MFNQIVLIGNIGSDANYRQVGEHTVASFSLATTKRKGDQEKTEWHNVEVWNKTANALKPFSTKGTGLVVVGQIKTESYEKDGVKKYITKVTATYVGVNVFSAVTKREKPEQPRPAAPPVDDFPF